MSENVEPIPVILIVDDTPANIEVLAATLGDDCQVKVAASGERALEIANQSRKPDLILLDYMLPDVNGNIVCQAIKSNPEFENIKIVIVSGVVKQDEIAQLLKSGAEGFIRKPFDVTELTGKITEVLQMK